MIRRGDFALFRGKTKASEQRLLKNLTVGSSLPHSEPGSLKRAYSTLSSQPSLRNRKTRGGKGLGAGRDGELLTAVRTLKSSRLM